MYIYNYDRETKEYLGRQIADANPEETQKQGHFVPLVPANSTLIEPPAEQSKKARVFKNGAWAYTDDYRGDYKINSDLQFIAITKLNEEIEGYDIKTKAEKEAIEAEGLQYYKFENNELVHKTDAEILEEERASLDKLCLTKREVFLAIYKSKQITPEAIRNMINKEEQLIEFDYAEKFYRGNPLIKQVGNAIGYTDAELDYLFLHNSFGE